MARHPDWIEWRKLCFSIFCATVVCLAPGQEQSGEELEEIMIERFNVGPWEGDVGYSQALRVGQLVFVSGTTAKGASLDVQLKTIYIRIQSTLAQFDSTMDDVVQERLFTTDMDALKKAQETRKRFYKPGAYPTTTWLEVERLYEDDSLVEVEVVAVIRKFE